MKCKPFLSAVLGLYLLIAGCDNQNSDGKQQIAVTNSYLFCAVQDICGGSEEIVSLASPGMCPGHFDISPQLTRQLAGCKLLMRFDFQQGLDGQLKRFIDRGLAVEPVVGLPGLCIPETYAQTCREVCQILSRHFPAHQDRYQNRLLEICRRMKAAAVELQTQMLDKGYNGLEVVSSVHQAAFAQSLGLNVIGTFVGQDIATPAVIQKCLENANGRKILCVIANQQEGTQLAEAIASRLSTKVVVFSNFPDIEPSGTGFDTMLHQNIKNLIETNGQ